ncbi:MAG: nicotinate-nucleotide--dimethylbenzimidazole phosphoribosyltransferase [Cytophagales bacterium]|nr:nicotinate-nucleotide--dimethylbenzimidazole phosphoribosyltransferase [Cytophagales bacterium]
MKSFSIQSPDSEILPAIRQKIDNKTKPAGALGDLETIALQIAWIQQTLSPQLTNPHVVVFAADHGIAESGVSKYPQAVTQQMVLNFANGGAAINVFCRQHGIRLQVVDAGVKNSELIYKSKFTNIINNKTAEGTRNFLHEPAMTVPQCEQAIEKGADVVTAASQKGCNVIGFGEMGIGNTSAAAVLMHLFTGIPLADCVGRGTGLDDAGWRHKYAVLSQAVAHYHVQADADSCKEPLSVLSYFGGFEIVQMCGAFLQAAAHRMVILVDGFIATAALLAACQFQPQVLDYCVFCHQSTEAGHAKIVSFLGAKPLLHLSMRLGEGSGCAVAYPLVESAVRFFTEMASFESAQVSTA